MNATQKENQLSNEYTSKYAIERETSNWCDLCDEDASYCMCCAAGNYQGTNK